MTETSARGRPPVEIPPGDTLTTCLWARAADSAERKILRYYDAGTWRSYTWAHLADRVRAVAAGLIAMGVQPGDRIALMSPTRVEWTVADLAILAAGAVTVPIYETDSAEQCAWILSDAAVAHAFASGSDHAKRMDLAREQAPGLGEILVLDDGALDLVAERGDEAQRAEVDERVAARTGAELATIIYTSGTTGQPKGCRITHGSWVWTARQSRAVLQTFLGADDSTLLFLPLAHSFARLVQHLCLESDVQLGFAQSIDTLRDDLKTFRPTFLLAVPRVFEKVYNGAQRQAEGWKAKVFDFASSTAREWTAGPHPSLLTRVKKEVADKLVYARLREAMGGRITHCISGGAPLAPHLASFFSAAGIMILEGYGLTETCAPSTVNRPEALRIGTVGPPLPGVELQIADDGEILIRGGNVFSGYHNNEAATAEVLTDDGWFHTGDMGRIEDGFLSITGRKKELIITAGGKNVAPSVLEERLKANRLVSQAMVVGDNRPFIGALITLDVEELEAFAREQGLTGSGLALAEAEPVRAEVDRAVAAANAAVSRAESIREFRILERDFSLEERELTQKMSLRRRVIAEHFADEIDALYAGS